jgi:hypothetical protein
MPCDRVTLPDGMAAIVCSRSRAPRQRCACGKPATLLCDWKVPQGKNPASSSEAVGHKQATCDAPICASCTTAPAPDKDLCPAHAAEWRARQSQRKPSNSAAVGQQRKSA